MLFDCAEASAFLFFKWAAEHDRQGQIVTSRPPLFVSVFYLISPEFNGANFDNSGPGHYGLQQLGDSVEPGQAVQCRCHRPIAAREHGGRLLGLGGAPCGGLEEPYKAT